MYRVAIAGTGGLAQYIAYYVDSETPHQFIMLSRSPKPGLTAKGYQIFVVDYSDRNNLRFALAGIDVVISTVSGNPQLNLIDAAYYAGVRRFAPAEFEGQPSLRPLINDVFDRGQLQALDRLRLYSERMESTVFVCGILYERFAVGGMASVAIGGSTGISGEGDYLMDIRNLKAKIPHYNAAGQEVFICMTSASDVGRFVARALSMQYWPPELRMQGERRRVYDVVRVAEAMMGQYFEKMYYSPDNLEDALTVAESSGNRRELLKVHSLIATSESRYDFSNPNLNAFAGFAPVAFSDWLRTNWSSPG
ncbi:hypothetical protein GP486_003174 [Trichoglossum hirsutum]|uniref:NAD(P)-binding domain-containing protein n=1 Tax=Trichoglossum hirsutum TaxID=265104 RepID=A0A9P8RR12_9PEZI|nr:hypothetical protein GP486_003174 [Trichoglossum hirsutum]